MESTAGQPIIRVHLVTYRRPLLLKRALRSILAQTYKNFTVTIINDDPDDIEVLKTIAQFNDLRVSLYTPVFNRGATANFNIAFGDRSGAFISMLEDDNWWEPQFLETMYQTFVKYPEVRAVICNELIWREMSDGSWVNTGQTIWGHEGHCVYDYSIDQIAGSAKFCNSSTVLKTDKSLCFETPNTIPVDVTEHFRERMLDKPVVLVGAPLVNYAETIKTARSTKGSKWGTFQCLLIGSLFMAFNDKRERIMLAKGLWERCPSNTSPRAMTLIMTGLYIREARPLLTLAPAIGRLRFLFWMSRHPVQLMAMSQMRRKHRKELEFLVQAPLTQRLVDKTRKFA